MQVQNSAYFTDANKFVTVTLLFTQIDSVS